MLTHTKEKTSGGRCNVHNLQLQLQSAQDTHSMHIYAIALTDISYILFNPLC